jgi:predicted RNA-binding Zn-ribbon protein involved in translation (DUF1610 family)
MTTMLAALAPAAAAPDFAPFCAGCGVRLPPLRAAAIGCPHCGAELVRGDGTRATASRATPWLQALASLLVPGLGQALQGRLLLGVVILLTSWLIVPWFLGVVDAWRVARQRALAPAARTN